MKKENWEKEKWEGMKKDADIPMLSKKKQEEFAELVRQYGHDCVEVKRHNKRLEILQRGLGVFGFFLSSVFDWLSLILCLKFKDEPDFPDVAQLDSPHPWPTSLDHSYKGLGED